MKLLKVCGSRKELKRILFDVFRLKESLSPIPVLFSFVPRLNNSQADALAKRALFLANNFSSVGV